VTTFKMTSSSQPITQWGTNTEKNINETLHTSNVNSNSSHAEPAVRNRRKPNRNNVSRRDYHNAVGRLGSDNDLDDDLTVRSRTTLSQARTTKGEHERRRLRRHLKRKSRVPGHVQFTKWMHTESKNRIYQTATFRGGILLTGLQTPLR
jgi:hypothetical protein